jgi:hypothetical protein
MDTTDIITSLKIIIAKSPAAAEEAIRAIAAAKNNSPVLQTRYANCLIRALADPQAEFTQAEREQLAAGITTETDTKDFMLRVRMSQAERMQLAQLADAAGVNMSEFVRKKLFD